MVSPERLIFMSKQTAIIIGAGPAGLTAAYELLDKTDIMPVIFEASGAIGGISRTVRHQGNRIDIGGHRFFSKSTQVMEWWLNILPQQGAPARDDQLLGRDVQVATEARCRALGATQATVRPAPDPETTDAAMLVRSRLSRILFLRKLFNYPISLSKETLSNLGFARVTKVGFSFLASRMRQVKNPATLEQFYINQFGRELYQTFFRDYTEKVWGVSCRDIPADWGMQRVKGLSLSKAVWHALKGVARGRNVADQHAVETSLIEAFFYPKYGPGQLWEMVADTVQAHGVEIHLHSRVTAIHTSDERVTGVEVEDEDGQRRVVNGDYVLSTMPVRDLIRGFGDTVPAPVREVAEGLQYRDFMTVGVLAKKLLLNNTTERKTINNIVPDNWIYIQEPDVKVGRLQIFNNWSPYLVTDPDTVWIGMEYFVNEGDAMWRQRDADFSRFAIGELVKIKVLDAADLIDTMVLRVPKAYPAYFGTYKRFDEIRRFVDGYRNLFLLGRNGMHRYNNMDHSMLTAMTAVENIRHGVTSKDNLWSVNAEEEYHESK